MSAATGHPNPHTHADFYTDVPSKRLIAWVIDLGFTAILSAPFMLPILLLGALLFFPLLLLPVIWACVGFLYRWTTISSGSATWGMRIMAIELRDIHGQRLSGTTAFLHTLGSTLSFCFAVVQAVSIFLMATSERGQGLTDMVLGTTMLNKAA